MEITEVWSPFAKLMGIEIVEASPERVEAQLVVPMQFTNLSGVMHGGAIMALADVMGGLATLLNLSPDKRTTTIESKTNFLRSLPQGERAMAVSIPLHRGRTTMVWQTTISCQSGQTAAIITQTQIVLPKKTAI